MIILAYIIGAIGILLTVKPFFRSANWFVRIGDFPRLQILIGLAAALVLLFAGFDGSYLEIAFGLALAAAIVHQVRTILPFTRLSRVEVQSAREGHDADSNLRVLIFNVLMENERRADALALVGRCDPDIVMFAEPDENWLGELAPLAETHPNTVLCPLDNRYGLALYSRLELEDAELQFLVQDDIPSIHTKVVLRDGRRIALHGVHPRPPMPGENTRSTERDGELLLVGRAVADSNLPTVVAGDLNDVAWSRTTRLFKRVSGLLDPRVGRGFYNTFHAFYPFLRVPLDHVFHSHHFRLVRLERIDDSCGSDHFPVCIELSLESDAPAEQPKPLAAPSEKREANEVIGEALRDNRFGRLPWRRLKEKIRALRARISRRG